MKKSKLFTFLISITVLFSCSRKSDNLPPIPEHYNQGLSEDVNWGLASNYINDDGIESDDDVLAFENFESGSVTIPTQENRYANNVIVVSNNSSSGNYCAEHSWSEGENGPTCRFELPSSAHDGERNAYFVRMYIKFDESFHPYYGTSAPESGDYKAVGVKGFGISNEKVPGLTTTPCDGTNWYNVQCQFVGWGPSSKESANNKFLWVGHLYSYNAYPESAVAEVGQELKISTPATGDQPYRFSAYADPFEYIKFNEWYCYEIGLYLNTPGKHDGEARFWINGVLQSRTTNMRFRDIEELKPMYVHLNLHRTTDNFPHEMKRYIDNIVIAKRYIGPIKE